MADDNLIFLKIEVDTATGTAKLRDFVKTAGQSGKDAGDAFSKGAASIGDAATAIGGPLGQLADQFTNATSKAGALAQMAPELASLIPIIGGIGAAAAVLAAGFHEVVIEGAKLTPVVDGFNALTAASGQSAEELRSSMAIASHGFIDDVSLMRSANQALLLGLQVTPDKMGQLVEVSERLARVQQEEAGPALDAFIASIGRASPRMLYHYGITVDAAKAEGEYAASLGKTTSQLDQAEKQQAFLNAVIEGGTARLKQLGPEVEAVSADYIKLSTILKNVKDEGVVKLDHALGEMAGREILPLLVLQEMFNPGKVDTSNLDALVQKLGLTGSAMANVDAGGLARSKTLVDQGEVLNRLGIHVGEDAQKITDLKAGVGILQGMLADAPAGTPYFFAVRDALAEVEKKLNSVTDKAKEFTGLTGSRDKALPFPEQSPENVPFGGQNPFGKPTGTAGSVKGILDDRQGAQRVKLEEEIQDKLLQVMLMGAEKWSQMALNIQMAQLDNHYQNSIDEANRNGADTTQILQTYLEAQGQLEQQYHDANVAINTDAAATNLGVTAQYLQAGAAILGVVFEKNKKMQRATAIINTAAGIMQAFATIPPPGSYAAAAVALATGISQVAKINSTSMSGGGSPGGGGVSGGGGSFGGGGGADYSGPVSTPGNFTGTTPVVAGGPAPKPPKPGHNITINVNAMDSKSFRDYINGPDARRDIAEAVSVETSGR